MAKLNELDYVDNAEQVIKNLRVQNKRGDYEIRLTTSKIRNLLSMISGIYNDAVHDTNDILNNDIKGRIQYLRLRFAYEAGREQTVREFVDKADILNHISSIGDKRSEFLLFCRYMEALVAYHKFYGGRD